MTSFGSASDSRSEDRGGSEVQMALPVPVGHELRHAASRSSTRSARSSRQPTTSRSWSRRTPIWRVHDPLDFYTKFSNAGSDARDHYAEAERTVRSSLNSAISETSDYRMDQLFCAGAPARRSSRELEAGHPCVWSAATPVTRTQDGFGIEIVDVGINRIRLSEQNSKDVIERMKADRVRLAQETIDEGATPTHSRSVPAPRRTPSGFSRSPTCRPSSSRPRAIWRPASSSQRCRRAPS